MGNIRGYVAPINIRQTATTASGADVWALHNFQPRKEIYIRRIVVNVMCDVTTAVATTSNYQLRRFRNSSTVISGGTLLTGTPKSRLDQGAFTSPVASGAVVRAVDTGVTMGGATFDPFFASFGAPRAPGGGTFYMVEWPGLEVTRATDRLCIDPFDGVAIELGVTAVIGDGLQGWFEWEESGGPG